MRTRAQVSADKLRGGFYTPPELRAACLERLAALLGGRGGLDVLEPSAGDGGFVTALGAAPWSARVARVVAIEPVQTEAERCRRALVAARLPGSVVRDSAVAWGASTREGFDAALGNPPFVRYQFLSAADRAAVGALGERLGVALTGVGNLWICVLLAALSRLREGGAFAFVVPAECFTGCSAAVVRRWLLERCADVRFDLLAAGSFPGVLQEVAVLSGRAAAAGAAGEIALSERSASGTVRAWRAPAGDAAPWTALLLSPAQREAYDVARRLPSVRPLRDVARFEVSIVTGANAFFCADEATVRRWELEPWARPLLARVRHTPGLVHGPREQQAARRAGARAWLLDFGPGRPDPLASRGAAAYLGRGVADGLASRYKCRIREPWYRVPSIAAGALLLSKRSHRMPRLVVNAAGALTTDTIYRGWPRPGIDARDVAGAFHSSLTLLSAEAEGRSFGGGVLELVPSELGRLAVVAAPGIGAALAELDARARAGDGEALVERTDELLVAAGLLPRELVERLRSGREALLARRLRRNGGAPAAAAAAA